MRRTKFLASLLGLHFIPAASPIPVRLVIPAVLLIVLAAPTLTSAQGISSTGVVWQPPDDYRQASADLRKIRRTGFDAVRTGIVQDARLLALADQLGLAVYQDLPIRYLSDRALTDSLEAAKTILAEVVRRGRAHRSARAFGIASFVNTSDPSACAALAQLVEQGRSVAAPGTRFYYTTLFTSDDRCSDVVDLVLIDVRDADHPAVQLRTWYDAHDTPAGIAGVGTWVRPDAAGLQSPHSAEQQGRFIERRLDELLVDPRSPPTEVVFVYRWRDAETSPPLFTPDDANPYVARYGLHDSQMEERPAYGVVQGILTGRQTVFAFPQGDKSAREWPWVIILGWLCLLLIGIGYALSPRLRQMVPRYFRARGFYRDAIREGRDLLLGSSLLILLSLGLAAGVTSALVIDMLNDVMAFRVLMAWLPEAIVFFLARAIAEPLLFTLLVSAVYAGLLLVWILLMLIFSRIRFGLGFGQVLMLVVWPRWPLVLLMLAGLALFGSTEMLAPLHQIYGVAILVSLWIVTTLQAVIRSVIDYAAIARVPGLVPVLLLVLNPAVIAITAAVLFWLRYQDETRFLLHAIQRV